MSEKFGQPHNLASEIKEAVMKRQESNLLRGSQLIEEYKQTEMDKIREDHYYLSRSGHWEEHRDGYDSEAVKIIEEENKKNKLATSVDKMIKAGLLEEIKDHKDYPALIRNPEIKGVAISNFNSFCKQNKLEASLKLKEIFEIPNSECYSGIAEVVGNVMINNSELRDVDYVPPRSYEHDYGYDDSYDNHPRVYISPANQLKALINKVPQNILESTEVQRAAKKSYTHRIELLLNANNDLETIENDLDFLIKTFNLDLGEASSAQNVLYTVSNLFAEKFKDKHYFGGGLSANGQLLESILRYEKYFVTPQFYNSKNVKELVTYAIYKATLLPGFPRQTLEHAKHKFNISERNIDVEAVKNFSSLITKIAEGNLYRMDEVLQTIKYLNLSEDEVEDELVDCLLAKTPRDPSFLIEASEKLGLKNFFDRPVIQDLIQQYIIKQIEWYRSQRNYDTVYKWMINNTEVQKLLPVLKDNTNSPLFVFFKETILNSKYHSQDALKLFLYLFQTSEPATAIAKDWFFNYLNTDIYAGYSSDSKDKLARLLDLQKIFAGFGPVGPTGNLLRDDEQIKSAAVEVVNNSLQVLLFNNNPEIKDKIHKICESYNIPIKQSIEELVVDFFETETKGGYYRVWKVETIKNIAIRLDLSQQTQDTIANLVFGYSLKNKDENNAREIKEAFGLSGEIPVEAELNIFEKEDLISALEEFDLKRVINIIGLSSENFTNNQEVIESAYKMCIQLISSGEWDKMDELLKYIPIPKEMMTSSEAKSKITEVFLTDIRRRRNRTAVAVYKKYLSDLPISQISDLLVETKPFVDVLREKFPNLHNKYTYSIEVFLEILPSLNQKNISVIEENPFLSMALLNNDQFALLLLNKFSSLDKLSKENIKNLYDYKQKILEDNPDIDVNSRDFRIAMQNHLMKYRRNEEIISSVRKFGVNTDEWLNYEDELFFELGESSNVLVSEQIELAISRTSETVNDFNEICKTVVGEYKKELTEARITKLNEYEIKKEVELMNLELEKSVNTGDDKKAEGIIKGIKNKERQLENLKMIPAWDKFITEMERLSFLRDDILVLNQALKIKEEKQKDFDIKEINSKEKRREKQKNKDQIEKIKKEISNKNHILYERFESFNDRVSLILAKSLGKERTDAILQEITQETAQIMDHFGTDNETIKATVHRKPEQGLDGTVMKIGIWDRNPDIDLYMGNYTNCCIKINSDHMGEESTIADYLTDLGMQVVSIYDEKREKPVVAAWCWVGYDDDDNRSFIIDNIEADPEYVKYNKQFADKLKGYIEAYASKVKLGKIVQGKKWNDFVVAHLDSSYYKVGGYNRASGYYLDAENNE